MNFNYDNGELYGTVDARTPDEAKEVVMAKITATKRTIADYEKNLTFWYNFKKSLDERFQ